MSLHEEITNETTMRHAERHEWTAKRHAESHKQTIKHEQKDKMHADSHEHTVKRHEDSHEQKSKRHANSRTDIQLACRKTKAVGHRRHACIKSVNTHALQHSEGVHVCNGGWKHEKDDQDQKR